MLIIGLCPTGTGILPFHFTQFSSQKWRGVGQCYYNCRLWTIQYVLAKRELLFCLDINENSILPLQFYTSDDWKKFSETSFWLGFFQIVFLLHSHISGVMCFGHFHIMMWSVSLKLCFMMNLHSGQREHPWKPSLHQGDCRPPKNIPLNPIKYNPISSLTRSKKFSQALCVTWQEGKADGREVWMERDGHLNYLT